MSWVPAYKLRGKRAMGQPHFIVFANEKGGTGKSTTAVHTAIALAKSGHRVGAIDLDHRQRTLARYLENRQKTIEKSETALPQATFEALVEPSLPALDAAIRKMTEAGCNVIVIDTPGRDDPVARAAIIRADTLVTHSTTPRQ